MEYREFRAEGVKTDDEGKLTGLVTPFDRETTIGDMKRGGWKETVKPGCFRKTLDEADYLLVYQHDLAKPMARKSAGNLTFSEGEMGGQRGLVMDSEPVDTSYTRDCMALVRAKVINGMSFGFNVKKDAWFDDEGNPSNRMVGTRRELREVELVEGSPVTRPAYGGTAISARDEATALLEERAASINTAGRKALAAKGHALPDGSYPIPDKSHLHAAAVLAASGHGDVKAAKALIRRRAKELGVDVNTLPGFGPKKSDSGEPETRIKKGVAKRVVQMHTELGQAMELLSQADPDKLPQEAQDAMALISSAKTHAEHVVKKEKLSAADTARSEDRDDPDGKEYEAIDEALRQLKAGDVKGAEKTLTANQAARSEQEPETSTPDDEDDFALTVAMAQAKQRSRDLGLV